MLILTRRIDEEIVIDGVIRLRILGFRGSQVRIGIKAPRSITVDREEIHDAREKEKEVMP